MYGLCLKKNVIRTLELENRTCVMEIFQYHGPREKLLVRDGTRP